MTRIFDALILFLAGLMAALVVLGGYNFQIGPARIEVGQLDAFAVVLIILIAAQSRMWPDSPSLGKLRRSLQWSLDPSKAPSRVLKILGSLGVALFLTRLARHFTMNTHMWDVSCLHQPLFYPFEPTLLHCDACRNGTQFAEHILWPMLLIAPLTSFFKSNILVFLISYVAVLVPLYFFVTRGPLKDRRWTWVGFLALVLLSSPLRESLVWDFREDHLIFGFFLMSLLALHAGRVGVYFLFLMLGIASKENAAFVAFFLVVPLLLDRELPFTVKQRRALALATGLVCVVYTLFVVKWAIPHFMAGAENNNNILRRLPGLGSTIQELALNAVTKPWMVIGLLSRAIFTVGAFKYLLLTLAPFVLLGARAWLWMVPGIVGLGANVIASIAMPPQIMGRFHYELIILPFLIFAAALGLRRSLGGVVKWNDVMPKSFLNRTGLGYGVFVIPLLVALCFAGRPPFYELTQRLVEHGSRIPAAIDLSGIRASKPLAAQPYLWPHLNHLVALRLINYPGTEPAADRAERIRQFIASNAYRPLKTQGRDPGDALEYLVDLDSNWGRFLADELKQFGASIKTQYEDFNGQPLILHFETSKSLLDMWCESANLCRDLSVEVDQ